MRQRGALRCIRTLSPLHTGGRLQRHILNYYFLPLGMEKGEKALWQNYAIMRMEKRKLGSVGRICNHHERLKAEYKSNPDIDASRTHLNYHIVEPAAKYRRAVLQRIEQAGAKRRKDSVVMQDCFVGGTPEWAERQIRRGNNGNISIMPTVSLRTISEKRISFQPWCIWTEATPHMHLCFVPITDKGRLSSKDIVGGPKGLVKWQDKFYEYMHERYPDITRGTPARVSHRKHIPSFMFKVAGELYDHYGGDLQGDR